MNALVSGDSLVTQLEPATAGPVLARFLAVTAQGTREVRPRLEWSELVLGGQPDMRSSKALQYNRH
jgi:hypothetical protein